MNLTFVMATILTIYGCSSVPVSTTHKVESFAIKDLGDTPLGRLATDLSGGRPESESGFLLLDRGRNALAWRLFMTDEEGKNCAAT